MKKNMPKTINELIKILAYNNWAWQPSVMSHGKDKPTVNSLAEAQYPWTEKQAKLALLICKRYATKFESVGMEVRKLLASPVYEHPFRKINSQKIIEVNQTADGFESIEMKFPYDRKLVNLIRCCKENRCLPLGFFSFDGETKTWTVKKNDITTFYMTLIAVRYNFTFVNDQLLNEFEEIQNIKKAYKKPDASIKDNKITLSNVSESLQTYWKEKIQTQKLLIQLDTLKEIGIKQKGLKIKSYSIIGKKIAHNPYKHLWIDKNAFSKDEVILGLKELNCFPSTITFQGVM